MTPLQKARQVKKTVEQCETCANCVKIDNVYYCEASGKVLLPWFMLLGRCLHNSSDYIEKK